MVGYNCIYIQIYLPKNGKVKLPEQPRWNTDYDIIEFVKQLMLNQVQ